MTQTDPSDAAAHAGSGDSADECFRGNRYHTDARRRRPLPEFLEQQVAAARESARSPMRGITTGGPAEPGLFALAETGVPTTAITEAAAAYLASLDERVRPQAVLALDSPEWRLWSNIAPNMVRHGVLLEDLGEAQRGAALGLLRQALSPRGFTTARDVMKLNHTIAELTGDVELFGEWLYWLSVFGRPSPQEPWGFQIDGHHLIVNCLVVGDQIVTTPLFWGSEPVTATTGRYAGTTVFREEEALGSALLQSLTAAQRDIAVLGTELPAEVMTGAFRDDFELRYEGITFDELTGAQQALMLRLIEVYIGRTRPGHAAVMTTKVLKHLSRTHFAWIGSTDTDGVFYYRIHSPVILIEFDHLPGVAYANDQPTRRHVHTVVRTPNGNDYGKDLLRQHRERAHDT